jgi:hypothetical protein
MYFATRKCIILTYVFGESVAVLLNWVCCGHSIAVLFHFSFEVAYMKFPSKNRRKIIRKIGTSAYSKKRTTCCKLQD